MMGIIARYRCRKNRAQNQTEILKREPGKSLERSSIENRNEVQGCFNNVKTSLHNCFPENVECIIKTPFSKDLILLPRFSNHVKLVGV